MPAGVSRPLPTLMLVMLSFSASLLARRLSGAGVKICMMTKLIQSHEQPDFGARLLRNLHMHESMLHSRTANASNLLICCTGLMNCERAYFKKSLQI